MISQKKFFVIIFIYYVQVFYKKDFFLIFTFDRFGKNSWSLPFQTYYISLHYVFQSNYSDSLLIVLEIQVCRLEEQKNLQIPLLNHLIFDEPCSVLRCRNERCCCCKTLTTVHFVTRIAQLFFVKSIHEQLSALPDQHIIIKFRAINLKQGYLQPIKINIKGLKMHLYYDFQGTNYGSNGMGRNSLHFQTQCVSLKNVMFQTL